MRDCRVSLAADVRPDRFYPRHPRRIRLRPPPHASKSRGHSPRTILCGRPKLSVDRGRAGVEAHPYGGLRGLTDYVIAPHQRRPQPLSHGASRRDSSPSRGAKGWVKVCGVGATVYHDADTVVFLPPVRGGVPDAPRSRDRRAASNASVRPDRFYPRHPRSSRLASAAQRMQISRAQPAHHLGRANRGSP